MKATLGRILLFVALFAALPGCSKGADPAQAAIEAIGRADALIVAGDPAAALEVIASLDPAAYPAVPLLRAQALIALQRFDEAIAALAAAPDDTTTAAIRGDACVLGTLAAVQASDAARAEAQFAPCAESSRVDAMAAAVAVDALAGRPVPEVRLGELTEHLQTFPPSPEVDRAAELLESTALRLAETAEGPYMKLRYLSRAFEVGQDPTLRERLIADALREGEALVESDPQTAVSILEHLYIARVRGLEVPDEARARAEERSRIALRPVFAESFAGRYRHKRFDEGDRAAGILSEDGNTLTFRGATDEERAEAARAWLYRSYERPRPVESPDFLASWGQCPPVPEPCVLPFTEGARWAHEIDLLEDALAAELGRPLTWLAPDAE